jgi:hypothetical protein
MEYEAYKSLRKALEGRTDVPSHRTASRWIQRGWVLAHQEDKGKDYEITPEVIFQLRALHKLSPYFSYDVLAQVGKILQNRGPEFNGWLAVLENGKVVNTIWDTKPGVVIDGLQVVAVINLNRLESKIPNLLVSKEGEI